MEVFRADNDVGSYIEDAESKDREQDFKEKYTAILKEACENSSSSSNESLRHECPELYNDYRKKVMKHIEYLEGGLTQVQLDSFRDRENGTSLTIRELNSDESITLGGRISEMTSSTSRNEDSNTTYSYSNSSVDVESREYLCDNTGSRYDGINDCTYNNVVSAFEEVSSNNSLSNVNEVVENVSTDTRFVHEDYVPSNIPSTCEGIASWHIADYAMPSSQNGDMHMSDYALTGTEDIRGDRLDSSLVEDDQRPVRDYTPRNDQIGGRSCDRTPSLGANEDDYARTLDYTSRDDQIGGRSCDRTPSVGANVSDYGHTLDYTSRNDQIGGRSCDRTSSVGANESDYSRTLDYTSRDNQIGGRSCDHTSSVGANECDYSRTLDYTSRDNQIGGRSCDRTPLMGTSESDYGHTLDYTPRHDQIGERSCDRTPLVCTNESEYGHTLDYTPRNDQIGERSCDRTPLVGTNESDYGHTLDYTSRNVTCDRTPSLGTNEGDYSHTLNYTSRDDRARGHLPYRSMSTINERLGGHRQDEFGRSPALKKEFKSGEFERPADRGALSSDSSRDRKRQSAKSLEDVRPSSAVRPARPALPKPVSFYSFEQELSRCENALREAKAELREERKKQVVVDTFRMNLLEVDRMCNEEMNRLRVEAERLGPLNMMAAEWERDSRGAYWYDQYYNRDRYHSSAGTDFSKSYVRRLGDPEPCQTGEVYPPTI